MASTSTQNWSHSRETSQNISNFHNFSKLDPSYSLNYGYKVYEHSQDNIIDAPKSSQISDENPNFKLPCARTAFKSYYKILFIKILFTIKFIHKN